MNEKDPNLILKLEKAVANKYGWETTINPNSLWNEDKEKLHLEELKIVARNEQEREEMEEQKLDGFSVRGKLIKQEKKICSKCGKFSFSTADDVFLMKMNCCQKCYILHIEGR